MLAYERWSYTVHGGSTFVVFMKQAFCYLVLTFKSFALFYSET